MLAKDQPILSISEISQKIKFSLEKEFPSLWLKGELSNFIAHGSGHWYFSLKDEGAQIKGVMFRGNNQSVRFLPKTGDEILVHGRISTYAKRGDYQIICSEMQMAGEGKLQQEFERVKEKLKKEGLFDEKRKRELPLFPKHILIVTSPTGAAIRDILQILNRRFKGLNVTVIPALVQGESAAKSLINALSKAQKLDHDVLIIGRGGGSMEDLWAFNDEDLARKIAEHPCPVISAVGHEIDFTIADFVADKRAPTPSAAAELVVQNVSDVLDKLKNLKKQLASHLSLKLDFFKTRLLSLKSGFVRPESRIEESMQRLDEIHTNFKHSLSQVLKTSKMRLESAHSLLESLSPRSVMKRGFSIVSLKGKKSLISDSKQLKEKDKLYIEFFKGEAEALVTSKK